MCCLILCEVVIMIDIDCECFVIVLLVIFEVYGKEILDMVVKVWWVLFKFYNIDDVCLVFIKYILDLECG